MIEKSFELEHDEMIQLFGEYDKFAKKIERAFNAKLLDRDGFIKIIGDELSVGTIEKVLIYLLSIIRQGDQLTAHTVDYGIGIYINEVTNGDTNFAKDVVCITPAAKQIRPKTHGQKEYIDAIKNNMITFGVGPAGTGKTYLAVAAAVTAFKRGEVTRIILTRPAIEAGEKLGFLPGDLQQKIDPYLRPLFDALFEMLGAETFQKHLEKGLIEVAPLAYMRGRTLDNAFIILDEAQNTTQSQMKMFLTRLGFGSKAIINGDITQKDLPPDKKSGLDEAIQLLNNIEGISIYWLTSKDVVRHPLVGKIIQAYEA